jgi:hypothetical protein
MEEVKSLLTRALWVAVALSGLAAVVAAVVRYA